jgi:hypothetical protein
MAHPEQHLFIQQLKILHPNHFKEQSSFYGIESQYL